MQSHSHVLLSSIDALATRGADFLLLVGRTLLAWVFVGVAYGAVNNIDGSLAYFTSLKLAAPHAFAYSALAIEIVLAVCLILGIGTRYAAMLAVVFLVVATALGHRYWEYPAGPQQIGQYNNFLKNISIMGGALLIFVTGGGRFSLDRKLAR